MAASAWQWLCPGLGLIRRGRRRAGLGVALVVGSLWIAGLGLGGLPALDARPAPQGARAWFVLQAGVAASVPVERLGAWARGWKRPPEPALGRTGEAGGALIALAGLINWMAILTLWRPPRPAPEAPRG